MGLSITQYENEVSQWRDLWLHGGAFNDMITRTEFIHSSVMNLMGWQGVRLLHDHLVTKPNEGSNKKIPWHQDSMFWPVDSPGCSSWIALNDVEMNGGCLEVIDCSHTQGCEDPVDFMAKEKEDFPENSIKVLLPIKTGSVILMHSLTWHRSSPNLNLGHRPAHLSLWIHPDSNWRPDLVEWHPVNTHVKSNPKERLEGERFPLFGILESMAKNESDIHSGTKKESEISMFDASKIISQQIRLILQIEGDITKILSDDENKKSIVEYLIQNKISSDRELIMSSLSRLWISYTAYKLHQARNIYNDAYSNWWEVAGEKLQAHLNKRKIVNFTTNRHLEVI